jgi:hypothetical protein
MASDARTVADGDAEAVTFSRHQVFVVVMLVADSHWAPAADRAVPAEPRFVYDPPDELDDWIWNVSVPVPE